MKITTILLSLITACPAKPLKVLAVAAALCVLPTLADTTTVAQAQKDKELFDFSVTVIPPAAGVTAPTETPKVETDDTKVLEKTDTPEKTDDTKTETKTEETSTVSATPLPPAVPATPAALVADAETLIKDKLVQKYQVRLDEVISRMTSRLAAVSAEEQRTALTDLRDRISEKKTVVIAKKDLEPLKRDIILAILDHVIYRLEGLLKQSAQTSTTDKWAA